jgi:hypothetical protein
MPPEQVRAFHQVKFALDGVIERAPPNETQIDAAELLGREERSE